MYKYLSHIITIFTFTVVVYTPAIAITYYSRTSGDWDAASTWSTVGCGGVAAASIPGPSDDVIICVGHIVAMIDNPGDCYSLTISGTASWKQARTTNVGAGGLIMDGGTITTSGQTGTLAVTGTFTTSGTNNIGECNITVSGLTTISTIVNITSATGTKTFTDLTISGTLNNTANSDIYINGNLQNNGTFTIGTGRVTFGGATSNTVTGSSTTAFNTITINKGTSSSNVLDIQSLITMTDGGLTLTNGTFKLTGASTIVPFTVNLADPFLIPATCALWCNGGTINTPAMNWNVAGELRISAGTVNLGTASDNRFIAENDGTAKLTIEGGTFNVAGRISRGTATDFLTFTMTNGTIVVPTVGCTAAGLAPIMMDLAGSSFTMSGGTMIIRRSGATNLGFTANAGTVGITGGVIQFGDASTPASQTMLMNCTFSIANLTVNSANATCQLATGLTVLQAVNITAGTLNTATSNMTVGGSWTNNSTFTPGSNTVTFNGTGTQTITKTEGETFNNLTINKTSGTVILAYNINVNNTLTMTQGNIDCQSYTLTLGTGLGSTGTLTYTAGTIIGNFKRWVNSTGVAILFPIGTASYYRPASINFTNLTGGTLTANFVASDPGSSGLPYTDGSRTVVNQFTEGYWVMIATDGLASTNYYLECTGNGFTSYTIGASTRLMYRTTSGDPWSANGTHTDASGNTAKRTGVSGLSAQFAFGKPSCSPYVATSITGNTSVCISTTEAYSVNASEPANTYTWTITGGAVASGQGTPNITVNWGAVGMLGSVQVVEKNDCGDDNSPVTQSVYIHPIATSSITGVTSVAINETNVAYSVTNTPGYSYAWSLPLGGGTIDPPGTGNAITIDWGGTAGSYSVRVDVTRLCGSDDFQTLSVTVRGVIQSDQSGNWTLSSTWIGGNTPTATDYVEIQAAHTVTMNGNSGACRRLTINGTATWSATRTTDVGDGGVIINSTGNITGTGAGILTTTGGLSGISNSNISSTTVTIRLQTNSQNISSDGAVNILDITTTATNTGTLSIGNSGTLSGAGTLTQSANSTLNMNGTTFSLTTLNASASGNTVNYGANADQTIKPVTYNNLSVSGTGTKTLDGATAINGNLNISAAAATLDVSTSNHALTVGGNWSNAGGFNERYGSVTLNGSTTQTITNSAGETFNNLVFSSAGTKQLNNDVVINFNFTNSSPVQAGTSDMQVLGDWDNSGSYSADNDVTFSGTTTIMGASTTTFKNIIINGTVTGHATNMIVTGNFTNNGTFNHNNGKVTFTGTTTIGGTTISTFKDVDIQGTVTGPAGNMNVAGNWANSGAFNHGNGTVTFNSTTAMSGSGTHSFNNVTVSGTLTAPSGNVNIASNFQNSGTFNHGSGTVTFNGTSEISGTTDATFNNVVISSTLTGKSAGNFNVQGNFTNDGTFSHNSGTVTFNGTNSILGGSATVTTFNNMAVSSSKAAEVSSGKAITTDGTLTVDGLLTLKSPASDDATASLITNGSVAGAGDVKVERYVSSGRWWYVATAISDGTSGIYSAASYPTHKFYYYDEPTGWTLINNNTTNLQPMFGYAYYTTAGASTKEHTGAVNTGSISFPITYTPAAPKPGWNLLCNPYPSAIDWDAASGWTKTNMMNIVWIRKNGVFASYNGDTQIGTNGGTKEIASMQSMWIRATGAGTLGMTNAVRIHSSTTKVKELKSLNNILRLKADNGTISDETVLYFTAGAQNTYENKDTEKNFGDASVAQLSTKTTNGTIVTVDSRPVTELDVDLSIPLGFRVGVAGNYTITASELNSFDAGIDIFLEDIQLSVIQDLRTNPVYSFASGAVNNYTRFVVHFKKKSLPIELLYFSAKYNGSTVDINWTTATEKDNAYFTVEKSNEGISFTGFKTLNGAGTCNKLRNYYTEDINPFTGTSYYRLKQTDFDGKFAYSPAVTINIDESPLNYVSVYPNLSDGEVFVTIQGLYNDNIVLSLYNATGTKVYEEYINNIPEQYIRKFDFTSLDAGVYYLKVCASQGIYPGKFIIR